MIAQDAQLRSRVREHRDAAEKRLQFAEKNGNFTKASALRAKINALNAYLDAPEMEARRQRAHKTIDGAKQAETRKPVDQIEKCPLLIAREAYLAEMAKAQNRKWTLDAPPCRTPAKIICFYPSQKISPKDYAEYDRQLAMQETALNNTTVATYLTRRERFNSVGRTSRGHTEERTEFEEQTRNKVIANGYRKLEQAEAAGEDPWKDCPKDAIRSAEAEASRVMKGLAALHNPDMVAGGKPEFECYGLLDVNSDIGRHWKRKDKEGGVTECRVTVMDTLAQSIPPAEASTTMMNIRLRRCKGGKPIHE